MCVCVCYSKWLGELAQDWLFSFTLNSPAVKVYHLVGLILLHAVNSVTLVGNAQICNRPPPWLGQPTSRE